MTITSSTSGQPATRSSSHLGAALGTGRDWRRRVVLHHVPIALVSAVVLVLFMGLSPFTSGASPQLEMGASSPFPTAMDMELDRRPLMGQLTVATGYVAVGLLGLTLLIGPANLALRRRNPVNSYLRRDVGTWTAIASVVHVVVGLQVHGRGRIDDVLNYFVRDGSPLTNSFGLGNWTGLAALVIVVGLLALSTDGSLRELKAGRWKNLQRLNYALFVLVGLHAFFYGALLRMASPFTLLLIATATAVAVGQAVGIWLWRRRHSGGHDRRVPA